MGVIRKLPHGVAALALAAVIWSIAAHPWGWLYGLGVHPYPESSSTPWTYQMWSGILPALTVISLFGSVFGLWHLHNCHAPGCWRLGKHRVDGTPWCSKHAASVPSRALGRTDHDLLEEICDHLAHITNALDRQ